MSAQSSNNIVANTPASNVPSGITNPPTINVHAGNIATATSPTVIANPSTPTGVANVNMPSTAGIGTMLGNPSTPNGVGNVNLPSTPGGNPMIAANAIGTLMPVTPPPAQTTVGAAYNGHITRQNLLSLAQYVASAAFLSLVTWVPGQHDILAVQGPPNAPIQGVMAIVVGVVSREKAFLGTNGTFNARFSDPLKNAKGAKWQFTLDAPRDDVHFAQDWPLAINNLQTIQGQVAKTSDKRHMILPAGRIRMGHNIWVPKSEQNNSPNRNAITNNYPITGDAASWWGVLKETHQIDLMTVYDVNDQLNTRPETWEADLVGALVEATISIKHFYMGASTSRPEPYDVFSASVESLSILVKPAPVLSSPFRQSVSATKPRAINQSLTQISQPLFVAGPSSAAVSSATVSAFTTGNNITTAGPSNISMSSAPGHSSLAPVNTPMAVTVSTNTTPAPAITVTAPAPPTIHIVPVPPTTVTVPSPPTTVTAPAPPTIVTAPAPPNTVTTPAPHTTHIVPVPTTATSTLTPPPTNTAPGTTAPAQTTMAMINTEPVASTSDTTLGEGSRVSARRSHAAGKRREVDSQEEGASSSKRAKTD